MSGAPLSFDEFSAIQRRKRAIEATRRRREAERDVDGDGDDGNDADVLADQPYDGTGADEYEDDSDDADMRDAARDTRRKEDDDEDSDGNEGAAATANSRRGKAARTTVGDMLELPEVQFAMIVLIALDFCANLSLILMECNAQPDEDSSALQGARTVGTRVLEMFTGLAIALFAAELVVLLVVHRMRYLTHMGYLLDTLLVALMLHAELTGSLSRDVRLLAILRVWRILRVIQGLVDAEKAVHEATKSKLRASDQRVSKMQRETTRLEDALRQEVEARRRTEDMLRQYKAEASTLSEALRIAAYDVAGVGLADEDDEEAAATAAATAAALASAGAAALGHDEDMHHHDHDHGASDDGEETDDESRTSDRAVGSMGEDGEADDYGEAAADANSLYSNTSALSGSSAGRAPDARFTVREDGSFEIR